MAAGLSIGEIEKTEEILMSANLAWGMIGKKKAELLFSIFKKYRQFSILLGITVPDSPQHVGKLLKKPGKKRFSCCGGYTGVKDGNNRG